MKSLAASASRLWVPALMISLAGCASTPIEAPIPQATITNSTGKAISAVRYQPCGGARWAALPNTALAPGRSVTLQLPESCVDLNAYYADGKVAGSQRSVKREFPFTWVLY